MLGLLGLAAIPTTVHSYFGRQLSRTTCGWMPSTTTLLGWPSRPTERRRGWARAVYAATESTERLYRRPGDGEIQLFVARSYDPKKLYHHPELGVANKGTYTSSLRGDGRTTLDVHGGLPVHVLRGTTDGTGLALYALRYGDRFVENPYLFQLRSSLALLVAPRREMTLFLVHDRFADATSPVESSATASLLVAAIEDFLDQP